MQKENNEKVHIWYSDNFWCGKWRRNNGVLLTNSAVSRPLRQQGSLLALMYFFLLNGSAHRSTGWRNYGPHDHGTAISVVSRRYPCPGNKHGWYKWIKKWTAIKRDWSKSRKGEVLSCFYRGITKITWIHSHTFPGKLTILNVCVFCKWREKLSQMLQN